MENTNSTGAVRFKFTIFRRQQYYLAKIIPPGNKRSILIREAPLTSPTSTSLIGNWLKAPTPSQTCLETSSGIGFSFVRPTANIGDEVTTTVTIDNLRGYPRAFVHDHARCRMHAADGDRGNCVRPNTNRVKNMRVFFGGGSKMDPFCCRFQRAWFIPNATENTRCV